MKILICARAFDLISNGCADHVDVDGHVCHAKMAWMEIVSVSHAASPDVEMSVDVSALQVSKSDERSRRGAFSENSRLRPWVYLNLSAICSLAPWSKNQGHK